MLTSDFVYRAFSMLPLQSSWTVCALVVASLAAAATKRLYFHPLSHIPGPRLAALSRWYEWLSDIFEQGGGRFSFKLQDLHVKYGPVVRIRPNEVHIHDATWASTLYAGPGSVRDKDPDPATALGNADGTIATVEHHKHRHRRNAVMPFFTPRSIRKLEPKIQSKVEILCQCLQNRSSLGLPVDFRVYSLAWASDSLTHSVWDLPTNHLGTEESAEKWFRTWHLLSGIYVYVKLSPWIIHCALSCPLWVLGMVYPKILPIVQVHKDLEQRAETAVVKHQRYDDEGEKSNESDFQDIFQAILRSNVAEEDKSALRIAHEGFEVLAAGSITVARHLTSAIFHISANPDVRKKLKRELFQAIPDRGSTPALATLEDLPYLNATISETLRITQLIRFRMPFIAPREDLYYGDVKIPAGTSISMNLALTFGDSSLYSEPECFAPERWLQGGANEADPQKLFRPFGIGNRDCIGKHFAQAELRLALAVLFRRLDLQLFDTVKERDIDYKWSWILGEPSKDTKGVRVTVHEEKR